MDNDDHPIGRVLNRREALRLLVAAGAVFVTGYGGLASAQSSASSREKKGSTSPPASPPPCVVRPEKTEGPFFFDRQLERSDIRSEPSTKVLREGAPLALDFHVTRLSGDACSALAGALVDVWHCDAQGIYSGVGDGGEKFLRGYQVTDRNGVARFTTIYPGWYPGRTVHIHFKIRTPQSYEFTSQLFFDDAYTNAVFAHAPYARRGQRDTTNADDGIYGRGGDRLILPVTKSDRGHRGTFDIALDLSDARVGARD